MPSLPLPLADLAERRFGVAGKISGVARLSPGLLRLTLTCPQPKRKSWLPGQTIEFRVGARDFRHYSVMGYDSAAEQMTVLLHLHGDGPGAVWARGRDVGDEVIVLGPGRTLEERPGVRRLLLGDATAIGTFAPMLAQSGPPCHGAVEVAAADQEAARALLPGLEVVVRQDQPGAALGAWLTAALAAADTAVEAAAADAADTQVAYLVGHAGTIQALRNVLRAGAALDRRAIIARPYWADGRAGL